MATTVTQPLPARQSGLVSDVPDPEVPERARRRTYTAKYKRDVLAEYEAADRAGKGALLRREGLYSSLISAWRDHRDSGALEALAGPWPRLRPTRPNVRQQGCARTTSDWRPSWTRHAGWSRSSQNSRLCWRPSPPTAAETRASSDRSGDRRADSGRRRQGRLRRAAVGRPRATHYRLHRKSPRLPTAATRTEAAAPSALGRGASRGPRGSPRGTLRRPRPR